MILSIFMSETKQDIGQNHHFFLSPLYSTPPLGREGVPLEYRYPVWYGKTRVVGLPDGKKMRIYSAVSTEYRRVSDSDGLCRLAMHSPRYAYASHGNKERNKK